MEALKGNAYILLAMLPIVGSLAYEVALVAMAVTIHKDQAGQGRHDGCAGGTQVIRAG